MSLTREQRIVAVVTVLARYQIKGDRAQVRAFAEEIVNAACPEARFDHGSAAEWKPKRTTSLTAAKHPVEGMRVCSMCSEALPLDRFSLTRKYPGGPKSPTSRCRDCLNAAAKGRYLSAKMLAALNAVRLELVADDEMAGLRCLDCGQAIVAGDEVVCEVGLSHLACEAERVVAS